MTPTKIIGAILLLVFTVSYMEDKKYYSMEDFSEVKKIDVHTHVWTDRNTLVEQAQKDNFRMLNIVVDLSQGQDFVERTV